jgi:hypothetical protein
MSIRVILAGAVAASTIIGLNVGNAVAADRFGYCGVVNAYTPATQTQEGSLAVGSRVFRIAAGTTVSGTHAIEVGTKRCVAGDRDAPDRFTSLSAQATFLENTSGMVSEFKPATATAQGSLLLNGYAFFLIRAGTELPPDSASGHRSFALTISSAGDALITGRIELPPGWAAAPTTGPAPITTLPSTSTDKAAREAIPASIALLLALAAIAHVHARRLA